MNFIIATTDFREHSYLSRIRNPYVEPEAYMFPANAFVIFEISKVGIPPSHQLLRFSASIYLNPVYEPVPPSVGLQRNAHRIPRQHIRNERMKILFSLPYVQITDKEVENNSVRNAIQANEDIMTFYTRQSVNFFLIHRMRAKDAPINLNMFLNF